MPQPDETAKKAEAAEDQAAADAPDTNDQRANHERANAEGAGPDTSAPAEPVAAEYVDPLSEQLDRAERELVEARHRADETAARLRSVSKAYTDLQGEMKEFRERMEAHARVTAARKSADAIQALLEPVQNLRRSLETPGDDRESILAGLRMVLHQFEQGMEKLGLREVPGVGAPFDPNLHEALAVMPVPEPERDGRVLEVYRTGYVLGGHTIQAAQVVIGKYEQPAEA